MPTTAAGMQPISTMPHNRHVLRRSTGVLRGENGLSLWKYRMITARIAPIWITTKNRSRNWVDTLSLTNSSTKIIWPVELMGSHSVMPSTTPMKNAFSASNSIMVSPVSVPSAGTRGGRSAQARAVC